MADSAHFENRNPKTAGLDQVANFRDFGDVPTASGARVVAGRLFRAAHLANASDADLRRLTDLGITLIVDLRRPGERAAEPTRVADGAIEIFSNDMGADVEAPHIAFLRRGDRSDAAVERFLLDYYENAADEPRHRELFARSFKALETLEGGLLVHCAAGKDRTGLLVALIQTVLGVPHAGVLEEYLRTNAEMLTPARIDATRLRLAGAIGETPSDAVVHALLGVSPGHLRHALASITQRHGSIDGYLDALGVDTHARARIRERCTVPA